MLEVTISLQGKRWDHIEEAIDEVRRLLRQEYLEGFASNETGSYHLKVKGEEESLSEENPLHNAPSGDAGFFQFVNEDLLDERNSSDR